MRVSLEKETGAGTREFGLKPVYGIGNMCVRAIWKKQANHQVGIQKKKKQRKIK